MPSQTEKKPPALTAQTAASQQTSNFNSRSPPSQPLPPYCFRGMRVARVPSWMSASGAKIQRTPARSVPRKPPVELPFVLSIYVRFTFKFLLLFNLLILILALCKSRAQPAIAFADIQPFLRREEKGHGHEIRGALALRQSSVWLRGSG